MENRSQLYYIRAHGKGYFGNSPVWWAPNNAGYTSYLDRAGKYGYAEACAICEINTQTGIQKNPKNPDRETMHRVQDIDAHVHLIFDNQDFGKGNAKVNGERKND